MYNEVRTCYPGNELLGSDPRSHAEEDLVPGVEVVECTSERNDGVRWRVRFVIMSSIVGVIRYNGGTGMGERIRWEVNMG